MKNFLILIITLFYSVTFAQTDFITNISNRNTVSLNGKWKYIIDQYETGSIGFYPLYLNKKQHNYRDRVEYSFDKAQTLWVPGSWNAQKDELYYYEGSIWYRRMFNYTPKNKNSRIFIYIGAANYKAKYSLNGKKLGEHEGGFTPFSFEITNLVKQKDNFLIIGVSNTRDANNIPGKVTDWYNYGGIIRDVKIVEVPETFIDDYFIHLQKESIKNKEKIIEGYIKLNGTRYPEKAVVEINELKIQDEIKIDRNGLGQISFSVKNLELWSPEHPKLYEIKLITDKDTLTDHNGFRVIETKGTQILLNGKPVFLKGISIHDENPLRRDRANSVDDARLILGWAKELGCNFARLAHYPHQENIVRLADEMGIMLWEELPLYWGINWKNEEVLKKAKNQYSELIRRDKNRACTIIWSVANETGNNSARNKFLNTLIDFVKSQDQTRLISAAIKKDLWDSTDSIDIYKVSDPLIENLDILSFNEYQGWYDGPPELCRKRKFIFEYKKPILISEFGGGALQGFFSDTMEIWSEDFQALIYKENIEMFKRIPELSGMTPWILVDFQSPLRQLPDVQDGWNRKGIISEKGVKKKAFFVLKNFYSEKTK